MKTEKETETKVKPSLTVISKFRETYLSLYPEDKWLNYDKLSKKLSDKFNVEITGRDLWLLTEPSIEEDIIDLEQQYENLGL